MLRTQQALDVGKTLQDLYKEELDKVGGSTALPMLQMNAFDVANVRYKNIEKATEEDRDKFAQRAAERVADVDRILTKASKIPMSEIAKTFADYGLASADNTIASTLNAFLRDPIGGFAFVAETGVETVPVLAASVAATAATRNPGSVLSCLAAAALQ